MRKTAFTTGEVANICGVSADTVSRWFDLGQIEGYRLGPGGDRRIPRDKLRDFMLKHGIPLDRLEGEKTAILILENDPLCLDLVSTAMRRIGGFTVISATTGFECGLRIAEYNPQLLVLSLDLAELTPRHICQCVKGRNETHYTAILGLNSSPQHEDAQSLLDAGVDSLVAKPVDAEELVAKAREMLALPPGKISRPKRPIAV